MIQKNFWTTKLGQYIQTHCGGIEQELRNTTGDEMPHPDILESVVAFDPTFHQFTTRQVRETIDTALMDYRKWWESLEKKQKAQTKTRSLSMADDPQVKRSGKGIWYYTSYVIIAVCLEALIFFGLDCKYNFFQIVGSFLVGAMIATAVLIKD